MSSKEMYYKRLISEELKCLLIDGGELHWLFNLVKGRDELDFLIGTNNSKQWISVYCGTTSLLEITFTSRLVRISAHKKYINLAQNNSLNIYGSKETANLNFEDDFVQFLSFLHQNNHLKRHYGNKKEGYFQNLFSRQFGILSNGSEDFVVIDKEAVVGYKNMQVKANYFDKQREKFKAIKQHLSEFDAKRYGSNIGKEALGNELDFLAVNRDGKVLLIEFKHGSSTKGIYLSPIQIGLYYSIFQDYIHHYKQNFIDDIGEMIKQKKDLKMISQDFPEVTPSGEIVPLLIIAKYNPRSSALDSFRNVLEICREELKVNSFLSNLEVYEYDEDQKFKPVLY
ncbi:hypothetical protein ACFL3G_06590 [Planctomycetota bacterium]